MTDTKEELDSDAEARQAVGRNHLFQLSTLRYSWDDEAKKMCIAFLQIPPLFFGKYSKIEKLFPIIIDTHKGEY